MAQALWRKSSYSGNGNDCVEVGQAPTGVTVRDTQDRAGAQLRVPDTTWDAFLARLKG